MQTHRFYEFGPFRIDTRERTLLRDGETVQLTPKAFDTLLVLAQNSPNLVMREELIKAVWPDSFVEEGNLNFNISVLRKTLGAGAGEYQFIETVPRRGYRFVAAVREVPEPETQVIITERTRSSVTIQQEEKSRPRWLFGLSILVLALLIAGVAFYVQSQRRRDLGVATESRTLPVGATTARRSIAVLGFRNQAGRAESAWLSTALAEMLNTELAAGEKLRLISGENVARMKLELALPDADSFAPDTLARIRANLGTDLVVLGSYSALGKESGGQLRLDLRLQDTGSGETLAAIAETGSEAKLFDLVWQAGVHLRERLGVEGLSTDDAVGLRASLPANQEAARLYAEGLTKLRLFDATGARARLEKAVAADPDYPLSHSALADAWAALGYDVKARDEAQRAFELSAHVSRQDQLLIEGRYRQATKEWDKAIEICRTLTGLFPDNLDYGLRLAKVQTAASKGEDAFATLDGLRKLPPPASDDPRIDMAEAAAAEEVSDYKREQAAALNAAQKGIAQGTRLLVAEARYFEGWTYWTLGEPDKALTTYDEAKRLYQEAGHRGAVADILNVTANVYWDRGDLPTARKIYEQALAIKREIGQQSGIAAMLNNLANVVKDEGDLAGAKRGYEEAIAIRRETNERSNLPSTLANLGGVLNEQGDLEGARKLYEESVAVAREIGRKATLAHALANLAEVFYYQGELARSRQMNEEALAVAREVGRKVVVGDALFGLGRIYAGEGNLAEARKMFDESLAIRKEITRNTAAAETQLELAALDLEEGRADLAQATIREATDYFHNQREAYSEAYGLALLAQSLMAQGKPVEAGEAVNRAWALSANTQYRKYRLAVAIIAARVQSTLGKTREAASRLNAVINETTKAGFYNYQFAARLARSELEMKTGNKAMSRVWLAALETESRAKGFNLIAQKAAAMRG